MTDRFLSWNEFVDNFGAEMRIAVGAYQGMVRSGLKDWDTIAMDFEFVSDQPEKLQPLRACRETRYGYNVGAPVQVEASWEISGKTPPIPITADSLMYWALDLASRGYEFDATFDAYGGTVDPESISSADVGPGGPRPGSIGHWSDTRTVIGPPRSGGFRRPLSRRPPIPRPGTRAPWFATSCTP